VIRRDATEPARKPSSAPRAPLAQLLPLYIVVFAGFVGYSLMITVFTPMLLRADTGMVPTGASTSWRTIALGVLLCLYPLGQFIGSPVLGALSDRFGRRPVLLVSLAATTFCYAAISASIAMQNLVVLGAATLLAGLAEGNIVTAQGAIADLVAPAERNRYFGYIYLAASLAYIVGPLAGGKLAAPGLASWFGDATPFWASFLLLGLTWLAVLLQFRETATPDAARGFHLAETVSGLARIVTDRRLRRYYAVNFLLYLAMFGFFRSYPMYLVDQYRLDVSRVSEFVAFTGVGIVLANLWLTGFLSAHLSVKLLTVGSAIFAGIFMAAIPAPPRLAAIWPLLFLTSVGVAVCLPSCASLLSNAADRDEQGRVMGNNQALQVAGEALSGLAAGLLAAIVVKLPLLVLGAISVVAAILVGALI
jgi:DHA1 family tetracycline resistance protein-like MFS transporter